MKKNLLFIMSDLSAGGGQKSLVNLLSQLDFDEYNVDLFLFNQEGLFMELLPKEVHIVSLPETYRIFTLPFGLAILRLLIKRKYELAYNRLMFTIRNRVCRNISVTEQSNWKYLEKSLEVINKTYDAAIGFLEKTSIYFCVDKVHANRKMGWIHTDYDQSGMDPKYDDYYFKKLSNLITVSGECANILRSRFPDQKNKVSVIHNIVSPKVIDQLASQTEADVYDNKEKETIILSIGRLHYTKGFELAVEACKKLVENGYNIKWYIIGEGEERQRLTLLIKERNIEEHFILLGLKANPYIYIKQADIYAQTSRFEGKSIAVDEAKILHKPILVTNFTTARDQITDGQNGIIVEMNADAIANGIEKIIKNKELQNQLAANLSKEEHGTEKEIHKFYMLLEQEIIGDEHAEKNRVGQMVNTSLQVE